MGRVGDAKDGLRLLLTDDEEEASALAQRLERTERRAAGARPADPRRGHRAGRERARRLEADSALVLAAEGWHPGVIGIVASRVVERYGRPTFLIAFDEETDAREGQRAEHLPLRPARDALAACGDLLERFGGHRMAAGLTIRRDRLDEFRERFVAEAQPAARAARISGPSSGWT